MLVSSADRKVTRKRNVIFINVPSTFVLHQDIPRLSAPEAAEASHLWFPLLPPASLIALAVPMAPTLTPFASLLKFLPPSGTLLLNNKSMQKLDNGT